VEAHRVVQDEAGTTYSPPAITYHGRVGDLTMSDHLLVGVQAVRFAAAFASSVGSSQIPGDTGGGGGGDGSAGVLGEDVRSAAPVPDTATPDAGGGDPVPDRIGREGAQVVDAVPAAGGGGPGSGPAAAGGAGGGGSGSGGTKGGELPFTGLAVMGVAALGAALAGAGGALRRLARRRGG
jgi:hypothetical protein